MRRMTKKASQAAGVATSPGDLEAVQRPGAELTTTTISDHLPRNDVSGAYSEMEHTNPLNTVSETVGSPIGTAPPRYSEVA